MNRFFSSIPVYRRLVTVSGMLVGLLIITLCTSCELADLLVTETPVPEEPAFEPVVPDAPPEEGPEVPLVFTMLSAYEGDAWLGSEGARIGADIQVVADFEPVIFQVQENGTSQRLWEPHTVDGMRYCFSVDEPCTPAGEWEPFAVEVSYGLTVDWLGPRQIWLSAEFQVAAGVNILALSSSSDGPRPRVQKSEEVFGVLDESTPMADQPPAIQTAVAATRMVAPVSGSVLIEDGRCCAGGTVGETIDIRVAFEATSPGGEVTEMRVSTISFACQQEIGLDDRPWEPFVSEKIYPVTTATNWIGFYVRAQYRDAEDNLSEIYCDDISIEGMPPTPGS